ncbi:AAEL009979-PA [Aedes aegypti]|uniref:AAEL009979-PA n=1 Tax=Aedes aegypti TaxID=7159 RepID=Q16RQ5_AEDAE|nr:AAEL010869-PA [Aedes aegypti]EAT38095.1 AAEL009979-PA [Aedes aegypti]
MHCHHCCFGLVRRCWKGSQGKLPVTLLMKMISSNAQRTNEAAESDQPHLPLLPHHPNRWPDTDYSSFLFHLLCVIVSVLFRRRRCFRY